MSNNNNLSIDTTLNLVQPLYPKLLDLENSKSVLALDSLDPPLSTLCLLLDTHGLSLGAHDGGSAHKQPVVDVDMLALCQVRHKVASLGHLSTLAGQNTAGRGVNDRDGGGGG